MADDVHQTINHREKIANSYCKYCKKIVINKVKCVKCLEVFHKSCLKQATQVKNPECQHEAEEYEFEVKSKEENGLETENKLLRKIIQEQEDKYQLLQENCELLKEKIIMLEQQLKKKSEEKTKHSNDESKGKKMPDSRKSHKHQHSSLSAKMTSSSSSNIDIPERDLPSSSSSSNDKGKLELLASNPSIPNLCLTSNDSIINKQIETEKSTENTDNNKEWTTVLNKNRKYSKIRRPEPIKGTGEIPDNFGFSIAEKKACLFISGYGPNAPEEVLTRYLKDKLNVTCISEKMKTKYDHLQTSFKITVPKDRIEEIMSPDLWPKGITVNHFLPLRRHPMKRNDQRQQASPQNTYQDKENTRKTM